MVNLSVIILIFNKNILSDLLNFDTPQSSATIAIFRSLPNLSIWNRVTLSNQFSRRGALLKLSEGALRNPLDFRVASWRLLSVLKFAIAFWKRLVMTASLSPLLPVPLWRARQSPRCCRACGNGWWWWWCWGGGGGGSGVSVYRERGELLSSRTSGGEDVATLRTCAFDVRCDVSSTVQTLAPNSWDLANMQSLVLAGRDACPWCLCSPPCSWTHTYSLWAAQHRPRKHIPWSGRLLRSQLPPAAVACPLCSLLSLWRSHPPVVVLAPHALSACIAVLHHQVHAVAGWQRLTQVPKSATAISEAPYILCKGRFASAVVWSVRRGCPAKGKTWRRVRICPGDGKYFGTKGNSPSPGLWGSPGAE